MKLHAIFATFAALLSTSAWAADLAPRAARPRPPPTIFVPRPISTWNGLYVGFNDGAGWGTTDHTLSINGLGVGGSTGDFGVSGGLIGATIGFNQNMGAWIWGGESDLAAANIQGSTSIAFGGGFGGAALTTKLESLGTVRARVGLNEGFWFPYIAGGLAYGSVRGTAAFNTVGLGGILSDAQMRTGWTIGAGAEFKFNPVWSVKFEYLYVDLGNENNLLGDQVGFGSHIFRTGVNYKLDIH
jgi:outer membrane immunogenic protein